MCGRYFIDDENTEFSRMVMAIRRSSADISLKTGEIFPTNTAPILFGKQGIPTASDWGFPSFKGKSVIINARAETAAEKPTFRKSLFSGRCIVPASYFFEWSPEKLKYRFFLPDTGIMYLAGLSGVFSGKSRYVILTTAANASVSEFHNRMPVILTGSSPGKWLSDTEFALSYLHAEMPFLSSAAEK